MEIGMSNSLIGSKRTFQNASQQKIVPKSSETELEEGGESKRRKLDTEEASPHEHHTSIKITLPQQVENPTSIKSEINSPKITTE